MYFFVRVEKHDEKGKVLKHQTDEVAKDQKAKDPPIKWVTVPKRIGLTVFNILVVGQEPKEKGYDDFTDDKQYDC